MVVRKIKIAMQATALGCLALSLGCSKSSSTTSSSSTVSMSGTLSTSGSSKPIHSKVMAESAGAEAFDYTGYTVQCTTMDDPPQIVSGTVASNGSYSVSGLPKSAVGCQVVDSTGTPAAPIILQDSSSKDMKGSSKTSSRLAVSASADLGTVTFDADAGTAKATLSTALKSSVGSATVSNPYDFTGSYVMQKFDGTLPTGYVSACPAGTENCTGPSEGEKVYIKMLTGKSFTPDSTCSAAVTAGTLDSTGTCGGTTGTDSKYGILAWSSQTQFETCGSKLGFSYAEAKGYAGIDLTSSGVNEGAHSWSTSDGSGNTITEGWKFSSAKSTWGMQNCEETTVGSYGGYKCHDTVNNTYQVNLNTGGCVGSNGKPVSNINWSNVTWTGASSTETDFDTTNYPGYKKNVSTPTYSGSTITCTNVYGTFSESTNAAVSPNNFDWNNVSTILAANSACSTVSETTNSRKLLKLQCYANAMWNDSTIRSKISSGAVCVRKVRANWGTTDPTKFLETHGPIKAEGQHVAELFDYTADDAGTFRMREDDYRGVQNGGNARTTCHLEMGTTISLKKRSDGNLNMEFITEVKNLDAAVPACKSGESSLGVGTTRMMFKVVKQ